MNGNLSFVAVDYGAGVILWLNLVSFFIAMALIISMVRSLMLAVRDLLRWIFRRKLPPLWKVKEMSEDERPPDRSVEEEKDEKMEDPIR